MDAGQPVHDPEREARVLAAARQHAAEAGLAPDVAERLLLVLVNEALARQVREPARTPEPPS